MKVLWKSDWTRVNCPLEPQRCKCASLYFEIFNCAAVSRLFQKLFVLFGALPLCRVVSSVFVASRSESSAEAGPHAESQGSSEQENFLRSPPTQVGDRNSLWQHKSLSMVEKLLLIHCILLSV